MPAEVFNRLSCVERVRLKRALASGERYTPPPPPTRRIPPTVTIELAPETVTECTRLIWRKQVPDLHELASRNSLKPVSRSYIGSRTGKLIKEKGHLEASKLIATCLKSIPGGDPMDYIEGMKRGNLSEEELARKAMYAPVDYR